MIECKQGCWELYCVTNKNYFLVLKSWLVLNLSKTVQIWAPLLPGRELFARWAVSQQTSAATWKISSLASRNFNNTESNKIMWHYTYIVVCLPARKKIPEKTIALNFYNLSPRKLWKCDTKFNLCQNTVCSVGPFTKALEIINEHCFFLCFCHFANLVPIYKYYLKANNQIDYTAKMYLPLVLNPHLCQSPLLSI